jgi:arginyl-tRNA synthetase
MLHRLIEARLRRAVTARLPEVNPDALQVRPCSDPKFGDYQAAAVMGLAKERKLNPRQLAAEIASGIDVQEWCEQVEVAGAGFLNFRLRASAIAEVLRAAVRGDHWFLEQTERPRTIILDFSSPNIAKPMHVGHIRSTILGDSLARVSRALGHRVVTDNHIGDWGTQFGKLLVGWQEHRDEDALAQDAVAEMERLYRVAHAACEQDAAVLERARQELVKLQNGDPTNLAIWRRMIELSQAQFDAIYQRLGVRFDATLGESFYNPRLKGVVQALREAGIARESEGAIVVFFDDLPELKAHPAIIQKSDGAANYTTTDLATLAFRQERWQPDEIVYVTDGRQQLHFKQLFAAFRRWHPEAKTKLAHVWFGAILGEDGKPFRTRSGETIRLADLLDEAEERAFRMVTEKNPELEESERRQIGRMVGLGALKYADLAPNRQSDYVFNWDKMLALEGNTAPYLQYAYARIRSIFRKLIEPGGSGEAWREAAAGRLQLGAAEETRLAKHLLDFGAVIEAVGDEYRPNYLCHYLYELAGHFTTFYERCPVLKAAEPERSSRLALCDLTSGVLRQGLDLLGIQTPERM